MLAAVPILPGKRTAIHGEEEMNSARVSFAAFTDLHLDIMHDGERRLNAFFQAAEAAEVDFIIHLGDFCYPKGVLAVAPEARLPVNLQIALERPPIQPGKEALLERFRSFPKPAFHVLGNHDMDFCSKQDAMEVYGMAAPYYSFHIGGWHFIVLDGNHYRDDAGQLRDYGYAASYYRDLPYLGPQQLQWLERELGTGQEPTVIFCHQPLCRQARGMRDADALRDIAASARRRGKPVRLCMNGHLHVDQMRIEDGIVYHALNSISAFWAGEEYETLRYAPEIEEAYPSLRFTFPYEKPVFAIVTLSEEGLDIQGRPGRFVQPGSRSFSYRPLPTSCVRSRRLAWPGL